MQTQPTPIRPSDTPSLPEVKFSHVPSDETPHWLTALGTQIDAALSRGIRLYSLTDIKALLLSGGMQLWIGWDDEKVRVIVLTQIMCFPQAKLCQIPLCTGNGLEDWVGNLGQIEAWAKSVGCIGMRDLARPGWEHVLTPLGYRKTHVVMERPL